MKKFSIVLALLLALFSYGTIAASVIVMPQKPVDPDRWIQTQFAKGKVPPFSFMYGDVSSDKVIRGWRHSISKSNGSRHGESRYTIRYTDPKTGFTVECIVTAYTDFQAVDWVLRFDNNSGTESRQISQVKTADITFDYKAAGSFNIHCLRGNDQRPDDFTPYTEVLSVGDTLSFMPEQGRSSCAAFPFFNIEAPAAQQGVMVAIGWTGTWASTLYQPGEGKLVLKAGVEYLDAYLKPHEKIRTASVCLLFWQGEDRMAGHNQFRRFQLAHRSRHIDGKPVVYPLCAGFNYGDPTPCEEYTCITADYAKVIIQRYKRLNLVPECMWLDAGWYEHSDEKLINGNSWGNTVGNWVPDDERFPEGIRPVSDAAHAAGAKMMLWFEPERLYPPTIWGKTLPKEWFLRCPGRAAWMYDLGNEDALDYLCQYIGDFIQDQHIDYYRQDFNMYPVRWWAANDEPGRAGICEAKHVEGLYKFWDYLLERFPNLLIDNCASGALRLDYETMYRSSPMHCSDYKPADQTVNQNVTYGLNYFLVQHGAYGSNLDDYGVRSGYAAAMTYNWPIMNPGHSAFYMRERIDEYLQVRPYFNEDFYPLSGSGDITGEGIWLAYQLHRPSDDSGYIVAFRRKECADADYAVRLSGVDPQKSYILYDTDMQTSVEVSGSELRAGIMLHLDDPQSSLLIKYAVKQ